MLVDIYRTFSVYSDDTGSQHIMFGPAIKRMEIEDDYFHYFQNCLQNSMLTCVAVETAEDIEKNIQTALKYTQEIVERQRKARKADDERRAKKAEADKKNREAKEALLAKAKEKGIPDTVISDLSTKGLKALIASYK